MSESWRTFDHTGDLGLELEADTPERLHALAAEAVSSLVAEPAPGPSEVSHRIAIEGDDPSDLFVHWLNTALLEAAVRHAVWTRVTVTALDERRLAAMLEGQLIDPRRHVLGREIKAVSHHHLELELAPGACRARIVLDL
jgi:SHS2 domain-containing protein